MSTGLPQPIALLFGLLAGAPPPASLSEAAWDEIGVYALATGLAPLLNHNAGPYLPPMLAARMRLAGRRTATRNEALLGALAGLLAGCKTAGLPVIVLKGAYLAPAIYRDLSLRGMSDIDILVHPRDLDAFRTLLESLGYTGKHTDPDTGPGIVKHEWTYKREDAAPGAANPYLSTSTSFHVEPHTSLTESWFGLRLELGNAVWDHAVTWSLDGLPALALDSCDCMLLVAVHVIFHLLMGKPALMQLYDLRQLLEAFPDLPFDALRTRAHGASASAHLLAALRLAQQAFAAPVPSGWLQALAADAPSSQRRQAEAFTLARVWHLTQQPPLTTLPRRLRRGIDDRALAASWARDRSEAWRVWRSALLFHRTDTARRLWPHPGAGAHT